MITKEAFIKTNCCKRQLFFDSARRGFEYLLEKLMKDESSVILMPGYIGESIREGSGVFDPIRHTKVRYMFYKLNKDLSVDMSDFIAKIKHPNVKVVLLIHYFGFPQRSVCEIAEMCNKNAFILIEDCAHTFTSCYSGQRLGEFGDFSFFSIHKIVPTKAGGILQINNENYYSLFDTMVENIDSSDLSQFIRTDFGKVSSIRQENYNRYLDALNWNSSYFDTMFPELPSGVVPLNFPIIIKNYSREKLYYELIEKGVITVSLYYQMIAELPKEEFNVSYSISNAILNLPVHQDISEEDIYFINKQLKAICYK